VILHAIVADSPTALWAARHGATVVQLRLKDVDTAERVRAGGEVAAGLDGPVMIVINDDVEAAARLGVPVHLGQEDPGVDLARQLRVGFGRSASNADEARRAEAEGALYVGAGAVWETPSKPDAGPAIGLEGLAAICGSVGLPVIAVGGIDSSNAAACLRAGASGVAVIRGVQELPALRTVLESALAGRALGTRVTSRGDRSDSG
jgi:thiamine-phosphate pyrophosphorylase